MTPRFATWILAVLLLGAAAATRAEFPSSATEVRPLLVGSQIPDAALETSEGVSTTLHAAVGDDPAVIVFYRGGW